MPGDDAARRALARLARTSSDDEPAADSASPIGDSERHYRETIERAARAVDDVEAAARFVEEVGLDELEAAVERAEESVSACADDGRRVLETYREYQAAARGEQFHSGRGNSLGGADLAGTK